MDIVNRLSYNPPKSVFHFVGGMFRRIVMEHKLDNGNKRVALLFLIGSLSLLGYYFTWSTGERKDYAHHKTDIEKFVDKFENRNAKNGIYKSN